MLEHSDGETQLICKEDFDREHLAKYKVEDFGPKGSDKSFLNWLADRLVYIYKESPNTDYVLKLKAIAAATAPEQITRNIHR